MTVLDLLYFDEASQQWVATLASGVDLEALQLKVARHEADITNPHKTTKAQVGLGNVDNTSDANKPISTATKQAITTIESNISAIETRNSQERKSKNGGTYTSLKARLDTEIPLIFNADENKYYSQQYRIKNGKPQMILQEVIK